MDGCTSISICLGVFPLSNSSSPRLCIYVALLTHSGLLLTTKVVFPPNRIPCRSKRKAANNAHHQNHNDALSRKHHVIPPAPSLKNPIISFLSSPTPCNAHIHVVMASSNVSFQSSQQTPCEPLLAAISNVTHVCGSCALCPLVSHGTRSARCAVLAVPFRIELSTLNFLGGAHTTINA